MGIAVFIYGRSGVGKSRSLKTLGPEEAYVVNVLKKPMPFKDTFKYEHSTDNIKRIMEGIAKNPSKITVVDDAGYLMTTIFMNGHTGGGNQYALYDSIADTMWSLVNFVTSDGIPKDQIVYFVFHETETETGTRIRTLGRLLDDKVCLEGMVTIVLHAVIRGERHLFLTNSDGSDIAKSPEGMFPSIEMDNDLKMVDTAIREFYGLNDLKKNTAQTKSKEETTK